MGDNSDLLAIVVLAVLYVLTLIAGMIFNK